MRKHPVEFFLVGLLAACGGSDDPGVSAATPDSGTHDASDAAEDVADSPASVGTIRGRVTLFGRDPRSGIAVRLTGTTHQTESAADGSWQFSAVEPGVYEVQFSFGSYVPATSPADVEAGQTSEIPPVELYLGRPVDAAGLSGSLGASADGRRTVLFTGCDEAASACSLCAWDDARPDCEPLDTHIDPALGFTPSLSAFSEDGRWVAYLATAAAWEGTGPVRVWDFDQRKLQTVGHDGLDFRFAPTGAWLLFTDSYSSSDYRGDLALADLVSQQQTVLCAKAGGEATSLNAEWTRALCLAEYDSAMQMGTLRQWTLPSLQVRELGESAPYVGLLSSEDLERVLFLSDFDAATGKGGLHLWDGQAKHALGGGVAWPVFARGPFTRAFFRSQVQAGPLAEYGQLAQANLATGDVTPIAEAVSFVSPSDDGKQAFYLTDYDGAAGTLHTWDEVTGTSTLVASGVPWSPLVSVYPRYGVYATDFDATTGLGTLHLWSFEGNATTQLGTAAVLQQQSAETISYFANVDPAAMTGALHVIAPGTSTPELVAEGVSTSGCVLPTWNHDATQVVFARGCDQGTSRGDLYVWSATHGERELGPAYMFRVSPDFERILFADEEVPGSGRVSLSVFDVATWTLHGLASDADAFSLHHTEDLSRVLVLGACPGGASACTDGVLFWDVGGLRSPDAHSGQGSPTEVYVSDDFTRLAYSVPVDPMVDLVDVYAWDLVNDTSLQVGTNVRGHLGFAVSGQAKRAAFLDRFDPVTETGDLRLLDLETMTAWTIDTAVPAAWLAGPAWDWLAYMKNLGEEGDGDLWLAQWGDPPETVPVDERVRAVMGTSRTVLFDVGEGPREGAYAIPEAPGVDL